MSFRVVSLDWVSQQRDIPSAGTVVPALLETPARGWDYGAVTEPLIPSEEDGVLRLTIRVDEGSIGVGVLSLNFGSLLTEEVAIAPRAKPYVLLFAFPDDFGPCRLLVRTYGDAGGAGRAAVLAAEQGIAGDLPVGSVVYGRKVARPPIDVTDDFRAWAPVKSDALTPISLGEVCETKFQLSRIMQFRRWPESSELAFRLSLLPPTWAADRFGWELFDWQGTPFRTVITYLDEDFCGVLEKAELQMENGEVWHARLRTNHVHEFEVLNNDPRYRANEETIETWYDQVREGFEALAERFRRHLLEPGPFLYVHCCAIVPSEWDVREVVRALRARSPAHRFRILFVGHVAPDPPWGDYGHAIADWALRPMSVEKPKDRLWEGDDEAWTAALGPYRLVFPDGFVTEPAIPPP